MRFPWCGSDRRGGQRGGAGPASGPRGRSGSGPGMRGLFTDGPIGYRMLRVGRMFRANPAAGAGGLWDAVRAGAWDDMGVFYWHGGLGRR